MTRFDGGDAQKSQARLAALTSPVRLVFFTQTFNCDTCVEARRLLDEVEALSDKITVEEQNLILDKDAAAQYGVDRAPAIAVVGKSDMGIRFYGVPAGYEVASLIEAIELVASGESGLTEESAALLSTLEQPVNIQVFVTPT